MLTTNFWTQGQASEMMLDAYFQQQQRIAIGGIGELRGNGQFVRRTALADCKGWNEQTITDDLDLTLKLHINDWDIDLLAYPAVQEEGVTSRQRIYGTNAIAGQKEAISATSITGDPLSKIA